MRLKKPSILPGFGLTLGLTLTYASLLVFIPLAALLLKSANVDFRGGALSFAHFAAILRDPEVLSSFRVSFGCAAAAAVINAVFGLVLAWVLVRYTFPGKKLVDAMIDLPFALPTAVSGLTLTALYADDGWIGRWLAPLGVKVSYTQLGIVVALVFIGLPFVVRTLQPAIEDLDPQTEEAAASLGASRLQTFARVIFPTLLPALLTGFAMAFARGLGEYGSIVFISANLPMQTQIMPRVIVKKLEQFDVVGASAVAVVMLVASFGLLLAINLLQRWSRRSAWKEG